MRYGTLAPGAIARAWRRIKFCAVASPRSRPPEWGVGLPGGRPVRLGAVSFRKNARKNKIATGDRGPGQNPDATPRSQFRSPAPAVRGTGTLKPPRNAPSVYPRMRIFSVSTEICGKYCSENRRFFALARLAQRLAQRLTPRSNSRLGGGLGARRSRGSGGGQPIAGRRGEMSGFLHKPASDRAPPPKMEVCLSSLLRVLVGMPRLRPALAPPEYWEYRAILPRRRVAIAIGLGGPDGVGRARRVPARAFVKIDSTQY